jgi:hypothetical protein
MKLIDNWKAVLLKGWSIRWILLANVLGAMPMLIAGLDDYVSPHLMLRLMLAANCAAIIARFINQDLDKPSA